MGRLIPDLGEIKQLLEGIQANTAPKTTSVTFGTVASAPRPKTYPHYWSTYCIHELHDQCRLTCKHCKAPCLCGCHKGETA